jgi:hypothetical protein
MLCVVTRLKVIANAIKGYNTLMISRPILALKNSTLAISHVEFKGT